VEIIKTFFLLFAVIDPLGSIPVYLEAAKNFDEKYKKEIAIRAPIIAAIILIFFIVVGQVIMEAMKISLSAFQISGGIILFLFSLTMIFGERKQAEENHIMKDFKHVTIFPVAMPSIASPGAILAVVLLTDNHIYTIQEQVITTLNMLFVLLLTCFLLLGAKAIQSRIGNSGIILISKIMGLILASFAVQSVLSGIKEYFQIN